MWLLEWEGCAPVQRGQHGTGHIIPVQTHLEETFLPQASPRQELFSCNSLESLNWEPAPSTMRYQETRAPHLLPLPSAAALHENLPFFPPDNKPCPALGLTLLPCSAPGSQHQSICQAWCHKCIMENAIDPPRWGLNLRALMRQ